MTEVTLKHLCDSLDTERMLRDYRGPTTVDWARRSGVLYIEKKIRDRHSGPSDKFATDSLHVLNMIRKHNRPVSLLELSRKDMGVASLEQVSHISEYVESFVEYQLVTGMGNKIKKPERMRIPISLDRAAGTGMLIGLEDRLYTVNEERLSDYTVYGLEKAPVDSRNLFLRINIRNGSEIVSGILDERLTHSFFDSMAEVYPKEIFKP